jgi:HEAT repeat protein
MMQTSERVHSSIVGVCLLMIGCGGDSIDQLMAQLNDGKSEVRRAAAQALASQSGNSPALIAAYQQACTSSDVEVREIAVAALGQNGRDSASVLPILEQALADQEQSVRLKAALAIYAIAPMRQDFVPVLLDSLRAGHGTVFLEVGRMRGRAKWAVPTLVSLLSDRRAQIRALAAQALGEIGVKNDRVESSLRWGLQDDRPAVRNACQQALDRLE